MDTHIIDENDDAILYEDGDDKPTTIQATQRQINVIIAWCHTASSIKESSNRAAARTKRGIFNPTTYRTIPSNTKQTPTESIQQQYQHKSNPTMHPHDYHDDNKNTNKCKPCFPNFLPLT